MAIGVTLAAPELATDTHASLVDAQARSQALQRDAVDAVDRDVTEFDAVMAGYRLPRETEEDREARSRAIDDATVTATRGPLGLAETALAGVELVNQIEPLIKRTIVSDAEAGRDLLRGAALAALRTADINLVALEGRAHSEAPELRRRREAVASAAAGLRGQP
jgi:formiminotetrahydrofolate cyclodeaminase